ncbi:MAG: DUF2207 domain-containing protein [Clostridiaceae bacterium]
MRHRGIVITFIVLLLLGAGGYKAYGSELAISEERIYVEILSDGTIKVKDNIVFDFSGSFNGVYKDVTYDKASGIDITRVEEALIPQKVNSDYDRYTLVEEAENGDKRVYTLSNEDKNVRVKIFSPSEDTIKGFRISYNLYGAIAKYNDTAEFFWKFIGNENETDINRLEIYITFPEGITPEAMKVYGHGPLNGTVKILNDNTALFVVPELESGNYVEVRALFPGELIPGLEITSSENKLQSILDEEKGYAEEQDKKLQRKETIGKMMETAPVVMTSLLALLGGMSIFMLKRKDYNPYEKEAYNIDAYDPILLSYYSKPYEYANNTNGFIAQLLNLVRKKVLSMEYLEEKEEYLIKFLPYEGELMLHERRLVDFLREVAGVKEELYLSTLKEHLSKNPESYTILSQLHMDINQEIKKLGYTDNSRVWKKALTIMATAIMLGLSIVIIANEIWLGIISLVGAIAVLILGLFISVKSPEGEKAHEIYERVKKDVINYKSLEVSELLKNPEDLEKLMIYGALFNYNEELTEKITGEMEEDYDTSIFSNYLLWNIYFTGHFYGINVQNDISDNIPNPPESSSGSGSGGGFTSGGGGFSSGGGGGAGGF